MASPTASLALQICSAAELGDEARALLKENQPPKEYLEALIESGKLPEAVQFLAHALPKREAVWWAWTCARRAAAEPPPKIKAALDATETWVARPTEENRRAAMEAAEAATAGTAAGCAGMAAFFSGGSMAPPEAPTVPPGPYLTARCVAGAVKMAAAAGEPEQGPETMRAFLDQGMHVATRIKLW